jgi:PAS domain S-box-containing protein
VVEISTAGRILTANAAACDLFGCDSHAARGLSLEELFAEHSEFEILLHKIRSEKKLQHHPACLRRLDGSTRDVVIDANPHHGGGKDAAVHCVLRDESVSRRTEFHLREQAAFLAKSPEAVLIQGLEGTILHWNSDAETLLGRPARQMIGRTLPTGFFLDPKTAADARKATAIRGEWSGTLMINRADGSPLEASTRWILIRDRLGAPQSIMILAEDASEARTHDRDRLRAQRHECIGTLAGGIAHDLNNILQPISIAIDLFRGRFPDDEGREMLEMVDANLRRASELVRQILTFTSGAAGDRKPVSVADLFHGVSNFIKQAFPKTIRLRLDLPERIDHVLGDPTQLEQVLLNLCVNARDAMPEGGTIGLLATSFTVDAEFARRQSNAKPGPHVRLTVTDTGTGIPREMRRKIFEPFFTTKGPDKGTGLGLATAIGIIRSHGGFLTLETEEGCGSSFHVFLPAAEAAPVARAGETEPSRAVSSGDGESILLVDDEPTVLKVMRRSLEKSGYRVVTAADGEEGCRLFSENPEAISLVITDMAMPGMAGPEMIAALRGIDPTVKVICTSGLDTRENLEALAPLNVFRVLSKPCTSKTILQAIKDAIDPPATARPEAS